MEIFGYIASVIMGLVLGLLGGGGSILTVPILVYLFKTDPISATTSSLFIVGVTALITGSQYALKKEVNFKAGTLFALTSFGGIFLSRNFILPSLPDVLYTNSSFILSKADLILITFALLMIAASVSMLKKRKALSGEQHRRAATWKIALQGVSVGAVTGFVGAGGGFLILPALVNLLGLPMRIAVGTSLLIISANSLFGFSVSLVRGAEINWALQFSVLALAVLGSFVGVRLSREISDHTLKRSFGFFVLLVGILIILDRSLN